MATPLSKREPARSIAGDTEMKLAEATKQDVVILKKDTTDIARQGMPQFFGISGNSTGATGISMNLTAFGPGGSAKAHYHKDFETAIYGVTGRIALFYGDNLEHETLIEPGVFCFIPPWVPHKAFNLSNVETATALSARNDPNEQENVVLTPELDDGRTDAIVAKRIAVSGS
jgi:uncharacterized RmlC-like cupin family protein